MKNKRVRQMICDIELLKRNGCVPLNSFIAFSGGYFGQFVLIRSGWFFREICSGIASLASDELKGIKNG